MRFRDRAGERYGRLVAKHRVPRPPHIPFHWKRAVFWHCECDCGNTAVVSGASLQEAHGRRSCGCLKREHIMSIRWMGAANRRKEKRDAV